MIGRVEGRVGAPLVFEGYANDFDKRIIAVQFSLDGGATWSTYDTSDTSSERNLYWRFAYVPERAGSYELLVRSVNEDGIASGYPARVPFCIVEGSDMR